MDELLTARVGEFPLDQLEKALDEAAIAYGAVNTVEQLSQHPRLRRWPMTVNGAAVDYVAPPLQTPFDDGFFRPVPAIGEHRRHPKGISPMTVSGTTAWQSWIGRTTTATGWLDPEQANRMAVTLDREPTFTAGDPLPPAWQWLYFNDIVRASRLGEEGHPELGITMPPVPLPRRMWAAGRLEFTEPLWLGAQVQRRSTIKSVTPKEGGTGPLFFVTVEHDFSTDAVHHLLEEQTIVYREMSAEAELPRPAPAPADPELSTRWELDNTALFRYSALTFNGHRIHYDADYARNVEGYPDLVIHGPLIATLLADLASRERRPLREFTYRAKSPLFLPHPFTVNGRTDGTSTRLWAANHEGGLAMTAEARA